MRRRLPLSMPLLPLALLLLIIGALAMAQPSPPLQTELPSPINLTAEPGPEPGQVTLAWTPAAGAVRQWVWSFKLDGTDYRWHEVAGDAGSMVVAAGGKHTCMLQDDGTAVCWGANGDADQGQANPPEGVAFTAITAGYEHTCGITDAGNARCWGDDGTAQCWGSNEYGQVDASADTSFAAIAAGGEHSCGLREDGRVECWGANYYQQSAPPDALFYAVSAGTWHTCGIKQDRSIACRGANPDGQAPAEVEGSYQAVSAGGKHTCAVPMMASPSVGALPATANYTMAHGCRSALAMNTRAG